jgi:uncharacterized protein YgiM (DUF1202 family)
MKKWLRWSFPPSLLVLVALLGMSVFVSSAQTFGSNWTGAYYNNTSFSGAPVITRIDSQINFNFGTTSPVPGFVPTENYSVAWTGTQTFTAGTYRFTAVADDGVQVRIDGVTIIDRLAPTGSLQNVAVDVVLTEGSHVINVNFVQNTGSAVIQFYWTAATAAGPTATQGPTLTPSNTGLPAIPSGAITATVIRASVLNVRDAPSLGGNRLGQILRGQTYAIVGRNENATWFLLQLNNYQAWAWGYYLFINGNEFNPPVASNLSAIGLPAGVTDTGVIAVTQAGLKLRAEPNVLSAQIGRVTWGSFVPVVGRTAGNDWYQIVWKGTVGWVAAAFLEIRQGSLANVPVR